MDHFLLRGFICSLLLVSLTGVCIAAESPSYMIYIQGGESSLVNGTDGVTTIMVHDLVPYFDVTEGNMSHLIPAEMLTNLTTPLNAALVFSGSDGESASLVEVSNLAFPDGNKSLSVQVKPLEFYDGSALNRISREKEELNTTSVVNITGIGLYFEIIEPASVNYVGDVLGNNELAQTIADLK